MDDTCSLLPPVDILKVHNATATLAPPLIVAHASIQACCVQTSAIAEKLYTVITMTAVGLEQTMLWKKVGMTVQMNLKSMSVPGHEFVTLKSPS